MHTKDETPFEYSAPEFVTSAVLRRLGRAVTYPTLTARSTALVVVDMQNHFVSEKIPGTIAQARGIVPAINAMAASLRAAGGTVIWVQTTAHRAHELWRNHHDNFLSPETAKRRLASLAEDGEGYKVYARLDVQPGDPVARKIKYSAMIDDSSELPALLKARGFDTLLIAGTVTNTCCESTARDASMLGYKVVMLTDANAARERALHEATYNNFQLYFGDVASVAEVSARLA
jgi:ureidoacrylate peracid hydrolase